MKCKCGAVMNRLLYQKNRRWVGTCYYFCPACSDLQKRSALQKIEISATDISEVRG